MNEARLADEAGRLAALNRLRVLDTGPEPQFDKIVALVRSVLGVPMAAVTLVDAERQWFKARVGPLAPEGARSASFCTHTIGHHEPLIIGDATSDARFASSPLVLGAPHIRSYAGIPLTMPDGYNVGALCAIDTVPRAFDPGQIALLTQLSALVVDDLELRQIATSDAGTGALSRRGFLAAAQAAIERAHRQARNVSIAVFDVDHFKQVNDNFGHPAGDRVLCEIVARCLDCLRPGDAIGRMGGEEFAVLLPGADLAEAHAVAERMRAKIARRPFGFGDGPQIPVTASFGVAVLDPDETAEAAIARADVALYAAKRGGRNRCNNAALTRRKAA